MNCLVFFESERSGDEVGIKGDRLASILGRHRIVQGTEILAASLSGNRFSAKVVHVNTQEVRLLLVKELPALSQCAFHLVVGIARPPTVKKVVHLAASVGVASLSFVRTENSEKSYLMSSALSDEEMHEQVLLSLEQVGGGVPPRIATYARFRPFLEDVLGPSRPDELRCAGDGRAGTTLAKCLEQFPRRSCVTLAIGGERGWTEFELESLRSVGFVPVTLGDRMFRVEHAAALFLGQLIAALQ